MDPAQGADQAPEEGGDGGDGASSKKSGKRTSQWEMNPEDLEIVQMIGAGSTSTVYQGIYQGKQAVAVKEIDACDDSTLLAVRRELQVMTKVDHPHILKLIGVISVTAPLRLCLEHCTGGTLFDLLHNCWEIPVSWPQRLKVLVDISSAMEYLHGFRKQIIHRDLKSLNIFLVDPVVDETSAPNVKIADFGFARIRERVRGRPVEWATPTKAAGSMHWMAPEVYKGLMYYEKADVFSYSIVTYEVICRHMAFEDLDAETAGQHICDGDRPDLGEEFVPAETNTELLELMKECWAQDPDHRPTYTDITARLLKIQADVSAQA